MFKELFEARPEWTITLVKDGKTVETEKGFDGSVPAKLQKKFAAKWKTDKVKVNNNDKTIIFTESDSKNVDANMTKIAQAIKGKTLFDFPSVLKKNKIKAIAMGYTAVKATVKGKDYFIASEKNVEDKGDTYLVQDGYVISPKG